MVGVGVGERVRGQLPASKLPLEPPTTPAHPGVQHHRAEQVDVEGAAGAAAGQAQAGGQLIQRLGMLSCRRWRATKQSPHATFPEVETCREVVAQGGDADGFTSTETLA